LFCLSCAATVSLQLVDVPLHVHGTKKHLYTVNEKTNDISVFTVDPSSGNLSASGRFASFLTPHWIQSSPPRSLCLYRLDDGTAAALTT
jgi:6-phosphogluconolactonase (cycloisomerase 2 family)